MAPSEPLSTPTAPLTGAPSRVVKRSTGTSASSDSSGTSAHLQTLEPEDVIVDIIPDGGSKSSNSRALFSPDRAKPYVVTERSFFISPRDANGRPTRKSVHEMEIVVSELHIPCIVHQEERLLYSGVPLDRDQATCVTDWLIQNYKLLSLQRVSVHLVQDMDASQTLNSPSLQSALEQRASVVAEATAQRAAKEAAAEDTSRSPTLKRVARNIAPVAKPADAPPKRIRRVELIGERRTIEETLENSNRKTALFEKEDPASAEMLIPAKLDLQNKFRLINALIESCKDDVLETKTASAFVSQSIESPDNHRRALSHGEQPCGPEISRMESSTGDEDEFRMALPIEGSEYDIPFLGEVSGKADYVTSQTESDDNTESLRHPEGQTSSLLSFGAPYTIEYRIEKPPKSVQPCGGP